MLAASTNQTNAHDEGGSAGDAAYAVLGLDTAADGNLVEIAYWCQVELLHGPENDGAYRRTRLTRLNEARARLNAIHAGSDPQRSANVSSMTLPVPRLQRRVIVIGLIVAVAVLATAAAVVWLLGLDGATAATVLAGVACAVAVLLWAALAQAPRTAPPLVISPKDAFRMLRVRPGAPAPLVTLSHQYLRGRAMSRDDLDGVRLLDQALQVIEGLAGHTATERPRSEPRVREPIAEPIPREEPRPAVAAATADAGALPSVATATGQPDSASVAALTQSEDGPIPAATVQAEKEADSRPAGATVGMARRERTPATRTPLGGARNSAGAFEVTGGTSVRMLDLIDGQIYTVGAGAHCDLQLDPGDDGDNSIAEEHARIAVRRGRVLFHHVSEDGISLINGGQAAWAVLEPGDRLQIGAYQCRYLAPDGDPQPPPTTPPHGDQR